MYSIQFKLFTEFPYRNYELCAALDIKTFYKQILTYSTINFLIYIFHIQKELKHFNLINFNFLSYVLYYSTGMF